MDNKRLFGSLEAMLEQARQLRHEMLKSTADAIASLPDESKEKAQLSAMLMELKTAKTTTTLANVQSRVDALIKNMRH